jgi:hypothetical protein
LFPLGSLHLDGFRLYAMAIAGGTYNFGTIFEMLVPANSSNCPGIISGGNHLDSDLNYDCYVDLEDLDVIVEQWLNDDCAENNNCGGADFAPTDGDVDFVDFSNFALQWLYCNDPQDPNCNL